MSGGTYGVYVSYLLLNKLPTNLAAYINKMYYFSLC